MSTRATQNPEYWGSRFTLSGDDRELLLNLFVADEQPRSSDELAQAIIRHRVEREEAAIRRKQQAQPDLLRPAPGSTSATASTAITATPSMTT